MDTVSVVQSAFSMGTLFTIYTIVVAIVRLGLGITLAVLAIKCMLKYLKSNEN
ncbi:MAG: hypothetical protein PHU31_06620 [Anaerotignum sp.]|nr:hypothetical protein [Anaerotignum sp.]